MYLKQNINICSTHRFARVATAEQKVRLTEDWPPQDEVGVPCASWCCTNPTV